MKNFNEEISAGNSNQSKTGGIVKPVPLTLMNRRRSGGIRGRNPTNPEGIAPAAGGVQASGMGGGGNPGGTPTTPTPPAPGPGGGAGGGGMHGGNTGGTPPPGGGGADGGGAGGGGHG